MILSPRKVKLTTRHGTEILRTLPHREIRTIGAWCFVDLFGPTHQEDAMSVAAHPHTGLQTVSWLFEGEVEHRDSVGSVTTIKPGQLNLMTAGLGVAHSELSSADAKAMHGVQLWTVLPDASRNIAPMFEHFGDLPDFDHAGMKVRLFIGQYLGQSSPATVFSEMVGAEIEVAADSTHQVQLATRFENGLMLISGDLNVEGENLAVGDISYHAIGISSLQISSIGGAKFLLLGGVPFKEEIIMWWNFIGRTHEEIQAMRNDWENHSPRFAPFSDQIGGRIPAPAMPNLHLQARGNSRDAT